MPDSREREGMFCVSNITYPDGRWERPFYTMDRDRAYGYLRWLIEGGWRGLQFEQFRDGQWHDLSAEANALVAPREERAK
jgi:hypothetical protein